MVIKHSKTPTTYVPKRAHRGHGVTSKQELDLRRMAGMIQNEEQLLSVCAQTKPEMRQAGLDRIRPYLRAELRSFVLPI